MWCFLIWGAQATEVVRLQFEGRLGGMGGGGSQLFRPCHCGCQVEPKSEETDAEVEPSQWAAMEASVARDTAQEAAAGDTAQDAMARDTEKENPLDAVAGATASTEAGGETKADDTTEALTAEEAAEAEDTDGEGEAGAVEDQTDTFANVLGANCCTFKSLPL